MDISNVRTYDGYYEFDTYEEAVKHFTVTTGGYVDNPEDYIEFNGEKYYYYMPA